MWIQKKISLMGGRKAGCGYALPPPPSCKGKFEDEERKGRKRGEYGYFGGQIASGAAWSVMIIEIMWMLKFIKLMLYVN